MRVTVETERTFMRPMEPDDCTQAFKWCGDPVVNEYLIYPLYKSADDVRKWLEKRNWDDPDNYDLGICLKETGELIGSGGFVYHPDEDAWVIGYCIRADQWGNGYVPEAMQGLLDYISKERKVRAIKGEFAAENHKSRRVMEKLGMHFLCDGEYEKADGSRKFASKVYIREF